MNQLNELVYLYQQSKTKTIKPFVPKGSKMYVLFKGILDQTIKTDEEASKLIYNADKSDKRYLMLKKNLNKKLTRFILISTPIDFDHAFYTHISFECQQELVVVKLLLNNNIYHNAERVLWKVIRKAEKFQLNNILLDVYQNLSRIYAIQGEVDKLEKVQTQITDYEQRHLNEQKYLRHLQLLQAMNKWGKGYSNHIYEKASDFINTETKSADCSIFCQYYDESIKVYRAYHHADTDLLEKHLLNIKTIFEDCPFLAIPQHQLAYYLFRLRCSIMKADTFNAFIALEECLKLSDYESFDRYEVQDLHVELLLKVGEYKKALNVLEDVKASKHFDLLNPKDQSAWILRRAYLNVFANNFDQNLQLNIGLENILAQCKPNHKDKSGYHLQLTIFSYLTRSIFTEEELDGNSLKMYGQRYLRKGVDKRSFIFLRYLVKYFQRKPSDKESLQLLFTQFLDEIPQGFSIVELIPYEQLFEKLLFSSKESRPNKLKISGLK